MRRGLCLGRFSMLPSKPGRVPFGPDECIVIRTPGRRGLGDPRERDPELLAADARSGLFSPEYLEHH